VVLSSSQGATLIETLRVALAAAADEVAAEQATVLAQAAAALPAVDPAPPHPALPALGASVRRDLEVTDDDTAAALGHPDPSAQVLGSPRLALWFELVSCDLLPDPARGLTHVGAGILVHHLGPAVVGETVTVECVCASVSGRRVVMACTARTAQRVVGLGVHHRVLRVGHAQARG